MTRTQIIEIVRAALGELIFADTTLFLDDVSERALTHKLAEYLKSQLIVRKIEGLQVDCEYNRNKGKPKSINLEAKRKEVLAIKKFDALDEDQELTVTTFPDILIHQRGSNDHNVLIIEAKKSNSKVDQAFDLLKLQAFTDRSTGENPYRYKVGLFIIFDVTNPGRSSLIWFDDGRGTTEDILKRLDEV